MSGTPGSLEIRVVPVTGGPPTIVTSTGVGGPGAGWGYDGYIYFDASGVGPLKRVRETGGPIESVQKDGATVDTCSRCSRYYSSIRVVSRSPECGDLQERDGDPLQQRRQSDSEDLRHPHVVGPPAGRHGVDLISDGDENADGQEDQRRGETPSD